MGYIAKSAAQPDHVPLINRAMTPQPGEVAAARKLMRAFEEARAKGLDRVEVDGLVVEVPTYLNAQRLLARAKAFGVAS